MRYGVHPMSNIAEYMFEDEPDPIDLKPHQLSFDELLEMYTGGREPLENWATDDLIKLLDAVDNELQQRGRDGSYAEEDDVPQTEEEELDRAWDEYQKEFQDKSLKAE
jgi:hypothetical protein